MPYRVLFAEAPDAGLRRLVREQSADIRANLSDAPQTEEAVHDARKHVKKIRAVLQLLRKAAPKTFKIENTAYRDVGKLLSAARDADVMIETVKRLRRRHGGRLQPTGWQAIEEFLQEHRGATTDTSERQWPEELDTMLAEGDRRIADWPLGDLDDREFVKAVVATYRSARSRMQAALESSSTEKLHRWRRKVKYHGYHTRLIRNFWKPVMQTRADELGRLGNLLGDDHDVAVLGSFIMDERAAFGDTVDLRAFAEIIESERFRIREKIVPLGRRLFAEKPSAFSDRLSVYLKVRRQLERP